LPNKTTNQHISICSGNDALIKLWSHALANHYSISCTKKISDANGAVIIIDSAQIDNDPSILATFPNIASRILVIGHNWPENDQINALVHGAAGYCGESEPPKLLLQAITSVIKGDIWIQRHLVPRVIGTLVKMKPDQADSKNTSTFPESSALLATLSNREHDVANMIKNGENNKAIATSLYISERTVKAHLTSIFKKLNVPDRLHLALYIKEHS